MYSRSGLNGVALVEEGVEGAAKPVIVEFGNNSRMSSRPNRASSANTHLSDFQNVYSLSWQKSQHFLKLLPGFEYKRFAAHWTGRYRRLTMSSHGAYSEPCFSVNNNGKDMLQPHFQLPLGH
jgi:hypothetical protein